MGTGKKEAGYESFAIGASVINGCSTAQYLKERLHRGNVRETTNTVLWLSPLTQKPPRVT